jgi:4-hydroxybenzoate polyprenyltransferase
MSQRVRLALWIASLVVLFGLAITTARLWADESWWQVISLCVFMALWFVVAKVRRRRRKRAGLLPPQ